MIQLFTHIDLAVWNLVIRGTVVFFTIVILLRISGKRQVGQMGATELVTILLISNAVQNSMNGGDNSLGGGLILATTLIVLGMITAYFTYRYKFVRAVFEGTPRLIIHNGKVIETAIQKELLSKTDVATLLRKQGVHHSFEVKTAVLETDGSMSLVRFADLGHRTEAKD